ncbi:oligosaccharide flippase family protein, partial [Chloroflexota bacterium]
MSFGFGKKVKNLLKPGDGLHQRAVRSGAWVFALRIFTQLFSLTRLVVLARILAPDDFGLMGIAMLAMTTLITFSEAGFIAA